RSRTVIGCAVAVVVASIDLGPFRRGSGVMRHASPVLRDACSVSCCSPLSPGGLRPRGAGGEGTRDGTRNTEHGIRNTHDAYSPSSAATMVSMLWRTIPM